MIQPIKLASDVCHIPLMPRNAVNAYVIGSTLIDAGIRGSGPQLLQALNQHKITTHVLTHAHADHQGASAHICQTLGIPLWCGEADRHAAETGQVGGSAANQKSPITRLVVQMWAGPGHPVSRGLKEGDTVEDFVVLHTPGHTPGHISLWRERDGVLIAGDVVNNMSLLTTLPGIHEPPTIFTAEVATNQHSIRKIAALRPKILAAGHGPVMFSPKGLATLAARLPEDRQR